MCQVESGHGVQTLGSGGFTKYVPFTKTYIIPPNVIVSPEVITAAGYGFATDAESCYATNVTTTGFTAVCWGSPVNEYYADGSGLTVAKFGYIVIDSACCSNGYIPDNAGSCRLPICLVNTSIGVNTPDTAPAHSYALTSSELPASLQLTQDYTTSLVWSIGATQHTLAEINRTGTVAGCEYTCTDGYIPDGASSCRLPVCKPNATIGVAANDVAPANASPLTTDELPSSLKLVRDYDTTLIADPTKRTELALPDGCQYSCNDGFKI